MALRFLSRGIKSRFVISRPHQCDVGMSQVLLEMDATSGCFLKANLISSTQMVCLNMWFI